MQQAVAISAKNACDVHPLLLLQGVSYVSRRLDEADLAANEVDASRRVAAALNTCCMCIMRSASQSFGKHVQGNY
jgi:hypothetical protein